jgi:hypothetical protein
VLCAEGALFLDWRHVTIDELRRLASAIQPIGLQEATPEEHRQVASFNLSVARFRELVVRARNGLVRVQQVSQRLAFEIRTLADALPTERQRADGGRQGG